MAERSASAGPATFGAVFRVPEFRVLWLAEALSVLGDQLARVALAVLVFDRTASPLWTGLVIDVVKAKLPVAVFTPEVAVL